MPSRQEAGRDPRTAPQTARAERSRHQAIYWYCTAWGDVARKVLPRGCAPFPRPTSAAPSTLDCAFAGGKGVVSSSPTSRKQRAAGSLLVHMLDLVLSVPAAPVPGLRWKDRRSMRRKPYALKKENVASRRTGGPQVCSLANLMKTSSSDVCETEKSTMPSSPFLASTVSKIVARSESAPGIS